MSILSTPQCIDSKCLITAAPWALLPLGWRYHLSVFKIAFFAKKHALSQNMYIIVYMMATVIWLHTTWSSTGIAVMGFEYFRDLTVRPLVQYHHVLVSESMSVLAFIYIYIYIYAWFIKIYTFAVIDLGNNKTPSCEIQPCYLTYICLCQDQNSGIN